MSETEHMREVLMQLAGERREGGTFCPSEAARRLSADWRPLMPRVREVAAELMEEGKLICTQHGEPAHPRTTRGAIRLARAGVIEGHGSSHLANEADHTREHGGSLGVLLEPAQSRKDHAAGNGI